MNNYDNWKQETPPQFEGDAHQQDVQCEICGEMNFESDMSLIEIEGGEDNEDCECLMCIDCNKAWELHSNIDFNKFKLNWKSNEKI